MSKIRSEAVCVFGATIINTHVQAIRSEVEGVLEAKDIEYIHRMRVASRRLRSALALFEACFAPKEFKTYSRDVREVTRALGSARDLDVQLDLLERIMPELSAPRFAPGLRRLQLRLKQQRDQAQQGIINAMRTLQQDDTLTHLAEWAARHLEISEDVYLFSPALYELAFSGINTRLKELLAHAAFIQDESNITELHNMRISAKRLRYTMEAFAELYGANLKPFIAQTRKFQDLLGDIHDADVWIELVPRFIQKERERIETYFGHARPLQRLLPGLKAFGENRSVRRKADYQQFLEMWKKAEEDQVWDALVKLINTPLDLEVVMRAMRQPISPRPEEEAAENLSPED